MKEEVKEKLKQYIEDGCNNEKNVLCILVYIRKLIENKTSANYPLIDFYCNWALHVEMDRSTAKQILIQIEKNLVAKFNKNDKSLIANTNTFKFMSFRELKGQLKNFLNENDLPNTLVNDSWFDFRANILNILKDSPLLNKNGNVTSFRYLRHELNNDLINIHCELDIKEGFLPIKTIVKQNITIFD